MLKYDGPLFEPVYILQCGWGESLLGGDIKVEIYTSPSSMHETGHSGPVHWDDPEGGDGEGGGRGIQDGGHMYIHG